MSHSTQRRQRVSIDRTLRRMISADCLRELISSDILCRKSLISFGGVPKTFDFKNPHKKKSHDVKCGERGGHSTS